MLQGPDVGRLERNQWLQMSSGGSEANVAIGASRLGVRSAWVGRVGRDPMGSLILRNLRGEGVDTSWAKTVDAPTGLMFKEKRGAGLTRIYYMRSGSAGSSLEAADIAPEIVKNAACVHVSGITAAISDSSRSALYRVVEQARGQGVPVSFDVNYRRDLWTREEAAATCIEIAARANYVFVSLDDAIAVLGETTAQDCAFHLAALGPTEVVVTRGSDGYYALVDGSVVEGDGLTVPVVDPVGAGDAFVAGYLANRINGRTALESLAVANSVAALSVSVPGDWEGLASIDEIEMLLGKHERVVR